MPVKKGRSGTTRIVRNDPTTAPQGRALSPPSPPPPSEPVEPKRAAKPIIITDDAGNRIVLAVHPDGKFTLGRSGRPEEKELKAGRAPIVLTGRSGRKIAFGMGPDGNPVVALGSFPTEKKATPKGPEWAEEEEETRPTSSHPAPVGPDPKAKGAGWKPVPLSRPSSPPAPTAERRREPGPVGNVRPVRPLSPESVRLIRKARRAPPKEELA